MDATILDCARGCAVGATIGDALGMPLEFGPRRPLDRLVREMTPGRLPAGTFTDDTEMALALAESLLARRLLDPADLAQRFAAWLRAGPPDVGLHTRDVLSRIAAGEPWDQAVKVVQQHKPDSAGNGSVMRCWPVALAHWDDLERLLVDSRLQSRVTHLHVECVAGSMLVNAAIFYLLLRGGRDPGGEPGKRRRHGRGGGGCADRGCLWTGGDPDPVARSAARRVAPG